jgi:glycosyltransferase involved in cell wall biosynthesis
MPHSSKETLTMGWCDGGMVDGRFTEGLLGSSLSASSIGINIVSRIRVNGNQIGRQRQVLFDNWADNLKTDWLLWIDSDIVLTPKVLKLLWDTADKNLKPIVAGLYFVSKENENPLPEPIASIFMETGNNYEIEMIQTIPTNKVLKVDLSGFGVVLMHKSIIPKLRLVSPEYSLFAEQEGLGKKYVSEDIVFFRNVKKADIPLYVHTGATVQHMKRFSFDVDYYNLYWQGLQTKIITK